MLALTHMIVHAMLHCHLQTPLLHFTEMSSVTHRMELSCAPHQCLRKPRRSKRQAYNSLIVSQSEAIQHSNELQATLATRASELAAAQQAASDANAKATADAAAAREQAEAKTAEIEGLKKQVTELTEQLSAASAQLEQGVGGGARSSVPVLALLSLTCDAALDCVISLEVKSAVKGALSASD